ncbi:hypothetical protein U9M48_031521 [Paspalum notatum var. saurae]|uniref:Uncharacterized protein n=1 Tax=Paspalum notatum var. saurae TaxID=547442 RepID=A0AAQ3X3U3_PASNO
MGGAWPRFHLWLLSTGGVALPGTRLPPLSARRPRQPRRTDVAPRFGGEMTVAVNGPLPSWEALWVWGYPCRRIGLRLDGCATRRSKILPGRRACRLPTRADFKKPRVICTPTCSATTSAPSLTTDATFKSEEILETQKMKIVGCDSKLLQPHQ